jgi:hypothetical protein
METLIAQVKSLASETDETGRAKLEIALRDALQSMETPWETVLRHINQVCYKARRY